MEVCKTDEDFKLTKDWDISKAIYIFFKNASGCRIFFKYTFFSKPSKKIRASHPDDS